MWWCDNLTQPCWLLIQFFFRVDIKVNSEVISNKSLFCVFGFFEFELLFFTDKWSSWESRELDSQLLLVGKDRNIYLTNTDLHVIRISDLLTPVCTKLVLSNCRMSKSFWMFFSSKSSQKSLCLVCNMFFPKVTEEELWGLRVSLLLRPLDKTQIVIWSEPFLE